MIIIYKRGLPKWMSRYRDGEEGVVGGGGASGAGRTASGLFFRVLVIVVTTASLGVQLNNIYDSYTTTKTLAGKPSCAVVKHLIYKRAFQL